MNFDKKNMKNLMFLITFFVIVFFSVQNIGFIWNILSRILTVLSPFLLGLIFAFILNVLLNIIEQKWIKKISKLNQKWHRPIALFLTILILLGGVFLLMFFIIPELFRAISLLLGDMPQHMNQLQTFLNNQFSLSIDWTMIEWNKIGNSILQFFTANSASIIDTTLSFTTSVIGVIMNVVLGFIFACYILFQKENLSRQLKKIETAYLKPKIQEHFHQIMKLSEKTFSNFLTGQVTEAILIGFLCFIGMLILRIPYASMISILVGFTALIPVFGAFIGTGIGALLILTINPLKALWFIIYIIVLQQVEGNFIYPKVVGKSVGLPSIWVFVSITLGGSLFGIVGMLFSVPICSILYSSLRVHIEKKIIKKQEGIVKS